MRDANLRQLDWMLKGFLRTQCDGAIYLASLIPMSIFDPKKLSEDLNPYREGVKLSPEQAEAKRQADGRRTFKRLQKFLAGFAKKKRRQPPKED